MSLFAALWEQMINNEDTHNYFLDLLGIIPNNNDNSEEQEEPTEITPSPSLPQLQPFSWNTSYNNGQQEYLSQGVGNLSDFWNDYASQYNAYSMARDTLMG